MTNENSAQQSGLANKVPMLYHCADCNYCVDAVWEDRHLDHVCPTLAHHSPVLSYSGRGYMSLARAIHEGSEFPLEDIADRVFTCTGCGNCERVCPIGLSPRDVNVSLREILVENDAAPPALLAHRAKLVQGLETKKTRTHSTLDTVDLLFVAGCEISPTAAAEVRASFEIIKTCNPNSEALGSSGKCCGTALAQLGFSTDASRASQEMTDDINIYPRVGAIVHANPKCQESLQGDPRIVDFPSWLADQIKTEKLQLKPKGDTPNVTYMNICASNAWNLAVLGLLKHCGVKISNPDAGAPLSMCCGAGGGLRVMAPESAAKMAAGKIEELRKSSAARPVMLVSDPACLGHLKSAGMPSTDKQAVTESPSPQIYGLAEFLMKFFELSPGNPTSANASSGNPSV